VFNWTEIWQHLGVPALAVAGILLTMGVASLTVLVDRLLTLRRSRAASRAFLSAIGDELTRSTVERVVAEARTREASHLARLIEAGLSTYRHALASTERSALTPGEQTRRHLECRIDELLADLKRGLPILASVGSVAPFVGLLGTVLGIISAFQGIASTGSGGLSSVSAGISEALIETALGLAVAIPAVLAFNYLSTSIARDELTLTNAARALADRIDGWSDTDTPARTP
jgi:biopolymer transport protein ExbB